jgi:hypothetical protein
MSTLSSTVNRVGAVTGGDGTTQQTRGGKTGETIVSQAHGKYYEATHRGNVSAAGSSPKVSFGVVWEEIPIV